MGNNLQDILTFDIDGFWHSTDYKYAYHIFTKQQDNGFETLYYINLNARNSQAKHGQVKVTLKYSVILKAMVFLQQVFYQGTDRQVRLRFRIRAV